MSRTKFWRFWKLAKITEIKPGVFDVYAYFAGKKHRFRFSAFNCRKSDPRGVAENCRRELQEMEDRWLGRKKRTTIAEFTPEYLRYCAIENAPNTVKADTGRLRIFAAWCAENGIRHLDEITIAVFDRFKMHFHEVRGGTNCNNYVSAVQGLLSHALRHNLIKGNPLSRYPKKRARNDQTAFFDLPEIERLLAAAAAPYPKYFLVFILNIGCRLGELMHLMWDDVTLPAKPSESYFGHIRITSRELNRTKSGRSRVLPITQTLYRVIQDMDRSHTYVFDNGQNEPLYRSKQWHLKQFKRLAEAAGVELTRPGNSRPRTIKTLRDSFATYLIGAGVDMFTVSQLLGHSSIRVTEQHYVHVLPGSLEAIKKLPY